MKKNMLVNIFRHINMPKSNYLEFLFGRIKEMFYFCKRKVIITMKFNSIHHHHYPDE